MAILTEKGAKRLEKSFKSLIMYVDKYITGDRKDKLLALFGKFKQRMLSEPASGKSWYHSSFIGGWIYHTVKVIDYALQLADVWKENGAKIDFTTEELVMAAIGHDFGKLGDEDESYYIPQTSDWHIKRGMLYDFNEKINYMQVPDRTLFIFQQNGIVLTMNETLGIKLADGLYDESNKSYLISYRESGQLKTNLPHILHQADLMASTIERDETKKMGE